MRNSRRLEQRVSPQERLRRLKGCLETAWSKETSVDPSNWSAHNPAWGQCAVTALVVQDELGGELLRAVVQGESHYWNRLPTGEEVDFTRQQFTSFPQDLEGLVRSREYLLSTDDTVRRYQKLRAAVVNSEGFRDA
jgi:hypothetical protein